MVASLLSKRMLLAYANILEILLRYYVWLSIFVTAKAQSMKRTFINSGCDIYAAEFFRREQRCTKTNSFLSTWNFKNKRDISLRGAGEVWSTFPFSQPTRLPWRTLHGCHWESSLLSGFCILGYFSQFLSEKVTCRRVPVKKSAISRHGGILQTYEACRKNTVIIKNVALYKPAKQEK